MFGVTLLGVRNDIDGLFLQAFAERFSMLQQINAFEKVTF